MSIGNEESMVPKQYYPYQAEGESMGPSFIFVPGRGHVAEHMKYGVDAVRRLGHNALAVDLPAASDNPTLADYTSAITGSAEGLDQVVMVNWSRGEHFGAHAASSFPSGQLVAKIAVCSGGAYGIDIPEPWSAWPRHSTALESCFVDQGNGTELPVKSEISRIMYSRVSDKKIVAEALSLLVPVQILPQEMKIAPRLVANLPSFTLLGSYDHIVNPDAAAAIAVLSGSEVDWLSTGHVPFAENPLHAARKLISKARAATSRQSSL